MDLDDLEPRKTAPKPKPLDPMSIDELRTYIAELKAEIARAEAMIASKLDQRSSAESLFKN